MQWGTQRSCPNFRLYPGVTEKKQNFINDNPTSGLKYKLGIISLCLSKATNQPQIPICHLSKFENC